MIGNPYLRSKFQVTKRAVIPARGVGRGLFELIRIATQETLHQAPEKAEVDSWVRGLFLYGAVLSSPLGRFRRLPSPANSAYRAFFQGPDVDVPSAIARAQALTRDVLERLSTLMAHTHFTARLRGRFLDEFPEGSSGACAA
jgi:hypothetical protein